MTRDFRIALIGAGLAFAVGLAGCSGVGSPASPSSAGTSTGQTGSAPAIGLTGIVSAVNVDARSFTLTIRGGSRLVVADTDTMVWNQSANSQVRFSAMRDGMVVSIRGYDQGRYVLAQSIVITR